MAEALIFDVNQPAAKIPTPLIPEKRWSTARRRGGAEPRDPLTQEVT